MFLNENEFGFHYKLFNDLNFAKLALMVANEKNGKSTSRNIEKG